MAHGPTKDTTHTHTESQIVDLVHDDTDAIHDNESAEISALTEKAAPVGADIVLMEDSAASNAKKKITVTNMALGTTDIIYADHTLSSTALTTDPQTVASATLTLSTGYIYRIEALALITEVTGASTQLNLYFDIGTTLDPGTGTQFDANITAASQYGLCIVNGEITINSTSDAHVWSFMGGGENDIAESTLTSVGGTDYVAAGRHVTSDWSGSQTINWRAAVETTSRITILPIYWTIREQAIT